MNDKEFIKKLNLRNEKRAKEREEDSSFDPVKVISDLIRYQRMAIKIQAGKSGGK